MIVYKEGRERFMREEAVKEIVGWVWCGSMRGKE